MIMLCHEMKWDYWTYINQPNWFIDLLVTKWNIDIRYTNLETGEIHKKYGKR